MRICVMAMQNELWILFIVQRHMNNLWNGWMDDRTLQFLDMNQYVITLLLDIYLASGH